MNIKILIASFVVISCLVIRPAMVSSEFVVGTITVGNNPEHMVVLGSNIYVVNEADDSVSIVDSSSNSVTSTISVGDGPQYALVLGTKVYVANGGDGSVSIIDTEDNNSVETIPVGTLPYVMVALGSKIYITDITESSVSIIDTSNNNDIEIAGVGSEPNDIAVLGTKVYTANVGDSSVSVIDTMDSNSVTNIPLGRSIANDTQSLLFFGDLLLVAGLSDDGVISVIDTSDNNSVSELSAGVGSVISLAILGSNIYAVSSNSQSVAIIDTAQGNSITLVEVGEGPYTSAVLGTKIYAANYDGSSVSIIDTENDNVVNTVNTGAGPYAMVSVGNRMYVANYLTNTITVIGPAFTVSTTTVSINENSGTANFTVVLDSEPGSDVNLELELANPSIASVNSAFLNFTPANWSVPQIVTVQGVPDSITTNTSTNLTISVIDDASDDEFDDVPDVVLTVNVINHDSGGGTDPEPVRRSTGRVAYGCKDPTALNYDNFSRHDERLCEYAGSPQEMLNKLISDYQALVAALQGAGINARVNLLTVRDLEYGDEGQDVRLLQRLLNSAGFRLAEIGSGSPGNETTYFGELTRSALSAYQSANGISPTNGYFGPITRAQMKGAGIVGLWW